MECPVHCPTAASPSPSPPLDGHTQVSRARLEELNQGKKKKKGESIGWLKAVANKVAR